MSDPYREPHGPDHPATVALVWAAVIVQWAALGGLVVLAWMWWA